MVLSHLVLNDMVKVKGQVGELAVCLNDPDASIADISRMFFAELAKRPNNPVYNIFPDTLSCLSRLASAPPPVGDVNVSPLSRATLRDILRFLLSFVTKAAQTEALAERLLARLDLAAAQVDSMEERALAADIAFCLSVLPASDKTLRKLCEGVKGYAKVLANDNVWDAFSGACARGACEGKETPHVWAIESNTRTQNSHTLTTLIDMLARARRTLGAASGAGAGAGASARQETRALVDAWAEALAQARSGGVEDDAALSGAKAAAVRAKRVGAAAGIDVDAQAQAVLVEAANAVAAKKSAADEASKKAKAVAKPKAPKKKKASAGGGSDDENDEEIIPKAKARAGRAAIIEDDDEDDAPIVKPAASRSRGGAK